MIPPSQNAGVPPSKSVRATIQPPAIATRIPPGECCRAGAVAYPLPCPWHDYQAPEHAVPRTLR